MKKNMIIAAAVLASAVACTKEIEEPSALDGKVQMSFAVSTEQTKTVLEGTNKTLWTGVEKLSIFDGESNNLFGAELSAPSATAQFTGKAKEAQTYYALYPYNSAAKLSGTTISTELPAAQTAASGTFDPSAALLFGVSDGTSVTLKNLTAMLKLTVPANVTSIEVEGNGAALAGSVNVNVSTAEVSGATASKVTLSGSGALEAGTYYIAVAPATVSGLSVKLIDSANSKYILRSVEASRTLAANTIYDMGDFSSLAWTSEGGDEPSGNDLVIFDNAFKSGFSSTSMTEETVDGENCLKWELTSAAAWGNYGVVAMDPAIDFSNFDADNTVLKFKLKVGVDNGPANVNTLFKIYFGIPGSAVWVGNVGHNSATTQWYDVVVTDNEWHEVSLSLKDYVSKMSGNNAAKELGFTNDDVAAAVGTTIYFKDIRISGNTSTEPEQPTEDELVIFDNAFKSGFSSASMTEETVDGANCLKWELTSAAAWGNYGVIAMDPAIDFSNFDADNTVLKFKLKVGVDNGPANVNTLFKIYFGIPGSAVWVGNVGHNSATTQWYDVVVTDNEWHEVSLSLKDYVSKMSGNNAAKELGFTNDDVAAAVGTTIYFKDIRISGSTSTEPEQPTEDELVIFDNAFKSGFSSASMTEETVDGANCLKWELTSTAAWGNYGVIAMDPAIDFSNFDADNTVLKFKLKVGVDNGPANVNTLFKIYFGIPGSAVWVGNVGHNSATTQWYDVVVTDNEWHEVSLSLKDYVSKMSGNNAAKELGFTNDDVAAAVGTTIYFKDIRIVK